jgi:hypothetical protein
MSNCVCSWTFFFNPRVLARVLADSCGLRPGTLAPENALFHSLHAIPRSGLALRKWPEVRKGTISSPFRSTGYARTNQTVDFQHWQVEGPAPIRRMENARKYLKYGAIHHNEESGAPSRTHLDLQLGPAKRGGTSGSLVRLRVRASWATSRSIEQRPNKKSNDPLPLDLPETEPEKT